MESVEPPETQLDFGRLPLPRDPKIRVLFATVLAGQRSAGGWLAAGVFDELDELRDEHRRRVTRVEAAIQTLLRREQDWKEEDAGRAEELRAAHRAGEAPPADERTADVEREAERARLTESVWAAAQVLAEHVTRVVETVRGREDEWLADLEGRLGPAAAKRREAERLLHQARAEEFQIHGRAKWLKAIADNGPLFPLVPALEGPPSQWTPQRDTYTFSRHWSDRKPWNRPLDDDVEAA